jgi:GPI mannosyltransferase 3
LYLSLGCTNGSWFSSRRFRSFVPRGKNE